MKIVHSILSGGVGSRLWPLSRKNKPKQYLPIFRRKSLFQLTAERNSGLCDSLLVLGTGMFCFKAGVFLEELKKFQPKVYENSKIAFDLQNHGKLHLAESLEISSISVDYAVIEKTNRSKVVKSNFNWSDIGSFESLYDYYKSKVIQLIAKVIWLLEANFIQNFWELKKVY